MTAKVVISHPDSRGFHKLVNIGETTMTQLNRTAIANCFSIGRFGDPSVGIKLSLDRGMDELRPLLPHIQLDGFRVHRDAFKGCAYELSGNPKFGTVHRAELRACSSKASGKVFYTLKEPEADKVSYSIAKVNLRLPYAKGPVTVNGHELRLWAGVSGGVLVAKNGWEALVQMKEGERMTVFFEDGAVRHFMRQGAVLEEKFLDSKSQLDFRIEEAWTQLDRALTRGDGARENTIFAILSGVADLLHLTTRFGGGLGQEMRMNLIRNFFLQLSDEALELCHRKVTAILHQVDPSLVGMMFGNTSCVKEQGVLPSGVTDITVVRDERARAKREAEREARRLERLAAQPKKGPSGSKPKQTSNPKKVEKQKRKHG